MSFQLCTSLPSSDSSTVSVWGFVSTASSFYFLFLLIRSSPLTHHQSLVVGLAPDCSCTCVRSGVGCVPVSLRAAQNPNTTMKTCSWKQQHLENPLECDSDKNSSCFVYRTIEVNCKIVIETLFQIHTSADRTFYSGTIYLDTVSLFAVETSVNIFIVSKILLSLQNCSRCLSSCFSFSFISCNFSFVQVLCMFPLRIHLVYM